MCDLAEVPIADDPEPCADFDLIDDLAIGGRAWAVGRPTLIPVHTGGKQLQDVRHSATVPSSRGLRLLPAGPAARGCRFFADALNQPHTSGHASVAGAKGRWPVSGRSSPRTVMRRRSAPRGRGRAPQCVGWALPADRGRSVQAGSGRVVAARRAGAGPAADRRGDRRVRGARPRRRPQTLPGWYARAVVRGEPCRPRSV